MSASSRKSGGLVYSTGLGRMCPACRRTVERCTCKRSTPSATPDGVVRVSREIKGRGGKTVTLIKGLALKPDDLMQLAKVLKTACGSGGTVKDDVIEVQGDHCDRVLEMLAQQGLKAKRAGG